MILRVSYVGSLFLWSFVLGCLDSVFFTPRVFVPSPSAAPFLRVLSTFFTPSPTMSTRQIHAFAQLIDQLPLGVEESDLIDGAVAEDSARLLSCSSSILPFICSSASSRFSSTTCVDDHSSGPFPLSSSPPFEKIHSTGSCLHNPIGDPHHAASWGGQGDGVDGRPANAYAIACNAACRGSGTQEETDARGAAGVGWKADVGEDTNVHHEYRFDIGDCRETRTPPYGSSVVFKSASYGQHDESHHGGTSPTSLAAATTCVKNNDCLQEDCRYSGFQGRAENAGNGCSFLSAGPRTEETAASTPTTSVRTPISGRGGEHGSYVTMVSSPSPTQGVETLVSRGEERVRSACDGSGRGRELERGGGGLGERASVCLSSRLDNTVGVSTPCSSSYTNTQHPCPPPIGEGGVCTPPTSAALPPYHRPSPSIELRPRGGLDGSVREELCPATTPFHIEKSEAREWESDRMHGQMNHYPNNNNNTSIRSCERGGRGSSLLGSCDSICTPDSTVNKRPGGEERRVYSDDGTPTTHTAASAFSTPSPAYCGRSQNNEDKQHILSSCCSHDGIHNNRRVGMPSCSSSFHSSSSHSERSPSSGCPSQVFMTSSQTTPPTPAPQRADCCLHCPSLCSSSYILQSGDETAGEVSKQQQQSASSSARHQASRAPCSTSKNITLSRGGSSAVVRGDGCNNSHNTLPGYGTEPPPAAFSHFGGERGGGGGARNVSDKGFLPSFSCSSSPCCEVKVESHSAPERHVLSSELSHDSADALVAASSFSTLTPDDTHHGCPQKQVQALSLSPSLTSPRLPPPPPPLEDLSQASGHFSNSSATRSISCPRSSQSPASSLHLSGNSYCGQHHALPPSPCVSTPLMLRDPQQVSYSSTSSPPHGLDNPYSTGSSDLCLPPPLEGDSFSVGPGIYVGEKEASSSTPSAASYQFRHEHLSPAYHTHHSSSFSTCVGQSPVPAVSDGSASSSSSSSGFHGGDSGGRGEQYLPHGGYFRNDVPDSSASPCSPAAPPTLLQNSSVLPASLATSHSNTLKGSNHPLHFPVCAGGSQQQEPSSSVSSSSALVHRRVAGAEPGSGTPFAGAGESEGSATSSPVLRVEDKSTFPNSPNGAARKGSSSTKKKSPTAARSPLKKNGGGGGRDKETDMASPPNSGYSKAEADVPPPNSTGSSSSSSGSNTHNAHPREMHDVLPGGGMGGCSTQCSPVTSAIQHGGGGGGGSVVGGGEMYKESLPLDQRRVKAEMSRDEEISTRHTSPSLQQWSSELVGNGKRGGDRTVPTNPCKSSWSPVFAPTSALSASPLARQVGSFRNNTVYRHEGIRGFGHCTYLSRVYRGLRGNRTGHLLIRRVSTPKLT